MNTQIVILTLASASIHATWNAMTKKRSLDSSFIIHSMYLSLIPVFPLFLVQISLIRYIPVQAFLLMGLSGLFQFLYYRNLSVSYVSHEISLIYPLIRSLPIVLVSFVLSVTGESVSMGTWLGIAIIIIGSIVLFVDQQGNLFKQKNKAFHAVGKVVLPVVLGIAGYTISDAKGLEYIMRTGQFSGFSAASLFLFGEMAATALVFLLYDIAKRGFTAAVSFPNCLRSAGGLRFGKTTGKCLNHQYILTVFLNGLFINLSYILILLAISLSGKASVITALRQISIPLSTTIGIVMFHESVSIKKLLAILLIVLGVIICGLYR